MNQPLATIDWSAPWFAPWRSLGEAVDRRLAEGLSQSDALNAAAASPVRFVAHTALPAATPYEKFIFDTRCVPTREGRHDLFNGLCWMAFPNAKLRLNAIQTAQIEQNGVGGRRGAVRDMATVLDENGALLAAPPEIWAALRMRDWDRLFIELRPLWARVQLLLFGHALLEKLLTPRKAMTAHVFALNAPMADFGNGFAEIDRWLAHKLSAQQLAKKPYCPLPVLGVPGWCSDNEDPAFYDDASVFRSAVKTRSGHVPKGAQT